MGVQKLHSNKKNKDYRKVEYFVPPYATEQGYLRGGVITQFTPVDSKLGSDIKIGSIVVPEYEYDACAGRAELVGLKVVKKTPYTAEDFE